MNVETMTSNVFFPNRVYQFLLMVVGSMTLCSPLLFVLGDYGETPLAQMLLFCAFGAAFFMLTHFINKHKGFAIRGYYTYSLRQLALSCTIVVVILSLFALPFSTWVSRKSSGIDDVELWIGAIVLAPLVEEWMFRGVLLRGLLTRYRPLTAVLCNAMLFSLIHVRLEQVVPALLLGILTGIVFLKTRSLLHTMLLHMLWNTLVFCSVVFQLKESYVNMNVYLRCAMMLAGLVLATLLTIHLSRKLGKYNKLQ